MCALWSALMRRRLLVGMSAVGSCKVRPGDPRHCCGRRQRRHRAGQLNWCSKTPGLVPDYRQPLAGGRRSIACGRR